MKRIKKAVIYQKSAIAVDNDIGKFHMKHFCAQSYPQCPSEMPQKEEKRAKCRKIAKILKNYRLRRISYPQRR